MVLCSSIHHCGRKRNEGYSSKRHEYEITIAEWIHQTLTGGVQFRKIMADIMYSGWYGMLVPTYGITPKRTYY